MTELNDWADDVQNNYCILANRRPRLLFSQMAQPSQLVLEIRLLFVHFPFTFVVVALIINVYVKKLYKTHTVGPIHLQVQPIAESATRCPG